MFKALKVVGVLGLVLGVVAEGVYGWAATKSIVEIDKELINKYGLRLTKNSVPYDEYEAPDGKIRVRDFKPFSVRPIDNEDTEYTLTTDEEVA